MVVLHPKCWRSPLPEKGLGRDDVGGVEILQVWEHLVQLAGIKAQPLSNGDHHALPRILGQQNPTSPHVVGTLDLQGSGELVEDLLTFEAAAHEEVLASEAMVAAPTVGAKRSAKLRLRQQHNRVPNMLRLHLLYESTDGTVKFCKPVFNGTLHIDVMIPTRDVDKEEVPLGTTDMPRRDELCNLLQPLRSHGFGGVLGLQLRLLQQGANLLGDLDGVNEGCSVGLGERVPMLHRGDVGKGTLQRLVSVYRRVPVTAHNLPPRHLSDGERRRA
mmetsp:Transcript_79921/g.247975  ORF Transcript_79921/g.247975 Transcript_79921/m.247975 type:complete len:273 (-) Transcript_79921:2998-3816(-)